MLDEKHMDIYSYRRYDVLSQWCHGDDLTQQN